MLFLFNLKKFSYSLSICLFFPLVFKCAYAQAPLKVAVASNFHHTSVALSKMFTEQHGIPVLHSAGSSGVLFAQITKGAPFDVFLSADDKRPKKLVQQKLASHLSTYAVGKLVLWHPNTSAKKVIDLKDYLSELKGRIGLANPRFAPYGKAGDELLNVFGLAHAYKNKKVIGANVSQTFQFVDSGNINAGFVPLSLIKQARLKFANEAINDNHHTGNKYLNYTDISANSHEPIKQQLVMINGSKNKAYARLYIDFLLSNNVQQKLVEFGYANATQIND